MGCLERASLVVPGVADGVVVVVVVGGGGGGVFVIVVIVNIDNGFI